MYKSSNRVWISRLNIENYKSINDAEIRLEQGLNIVIGKNGAGKTNLLEFISNCFTMDSYFLTRPERWRKNLRTHFSIEFSVKGNESSNPSTFEVTHKKSVVENEHKQLEAASTFTVKESNNGTEDISNYLIPYRGSNNTDNRSDPHAIEQRLLSHKLSFLGELSISYIEFSIPREEYLTWLKTPASLAIDSQYEANFSDYSPFTFLFNYEYRLENMLTDKLANADYAATSKMDEIKQLIIQHFYEYSHKINIITQINNYTPIEDIRLNPNVNIYKQEDKFIIENLLVDFHINGAWIPWNHLSDGTKRAFHLIIQTVLVENGILLIEEPELGIHPIQLYQILDYLRKKAFTNQVIISTHSPLVLDILPPEDLHAITIAKMSRAGSKFFKLTEQKIQKARRYITEVGELSHFWLHSDLEND